MSSRSRISFTVLRTWDRNSSGERLAALGAISASTLDCTLALDCNHRSLEVVRSVDRRRGVGEASLPVPFATVAAGLGAGASTSGAGVAPSGEFSRSDRLMTVRPSRAQG